MIISRSPNWGAFKAAACGSRNRDEIKEAMLPPPFWVPQSGEESTWLRKHQHGVRKWVHFQNDYLTSALLGFRNWGGINSTCKKSHFQPSFIQKLRQKPTCQKGASNLSPTLPTINGT